MGRKSPTDCKDPGDSTFSSGSSSVDFQTNGISPLVKETLMWVRADKQTAKIISTILSEETSTPNPTTKVFYI